MKRTLALVAATWLASVASAQVLNVGNTGPIFDDLFGGSSNSFSTTINVATSGSITGFNITADALAATNGGDQTDMAMRLTAPNGSELVLLGTGWFSGTGMTPANSAAAQSINANYDFNFGDSAGDWTVNFFAAQTFGETTEWNNVVITLVPAPGPVALLGVGGLVAMRRRRN
ncbi:MAG: hypothetical protein H6815_05360 [Phycisphaeraceae bacterium]|nr:hypothetical protein [Phycisphaerales bacterium]MCB9859865.1 hypothetical protein [Phycisphaeraceae bacterium]